MPCQGYIHFRHAIQPTNWHAVRVVTQRASKPGLPGRPLRPWCPGMTLFKLFGSRHSAFVCGSRNDDEKGGIEEADTNGNSVNEHAPLLRRKYLVVPPTEKARVEPRPMSCFTTAANG